MQNHPTKNHSTDSEICGIMTKILNVPVQDIVENINLFKKINRYTLNCLYYLSQLETDQDKITAVHSLEFVCKFNKRIDEYLMENKPSGKS